MQSLLELLSEIAKKRDLSPELYLAELISRDLDPKDRVSIYLKIHSELLNEAEKEYADNDLVQAGEKYWGAVVALLNAIAELKGWEHFSHRDYAIIIERLADEFNDDELRTLFDSVEKLHANFYHNFLDRSGFNLRRDRALALIKRLSEYMARLKGD
ncbi:PaREP1 family protein [Vulcanisaeta distributa]|uniref:PaREP1 family protein n=1 Tax=Vulcanisaeta distributa (strain DSM 14429 / JCM 11212 / NBRC 100878 / IC-017) TaxID=572478 RepID=E1QTZ3_VULDI|nr:PaREP1 family protein [Vulcanisaeta distributa]ADN49790.1 PaREP1 family protein [Vulcanisaeta distributa DSM 14429]